jgi:peptide/nickel transport system substrate-binding protein
MQVRRNRALVAAVGASLALMAGACGGATGSGSSGTEGTKGGTLTILMSADFEHLDPTRTYVTWASNFSRLISRTLTTYQTGETSKTTQVAPDMATDLGRASDGNRTWTFTLKNGLKFEDGSPVTSADVKYGVERSFSDQLPEGPPYPRMWLNCPGYKGPYKDPRGCKAIKTPNPKTVVFHLTTPVPDFSYAVAMPPWTAIKKSKDTGVNYDNHPFSTGPYKIQSYQRGKQLVLVRNAQWDPKTDSVRTALPDSFRVRMGIDPGVIDQRLIADSGEDQRAITMETSVNPESVAKVLNDPRVKQRSVQTLSGCNRYLALNTKRKPFDNLQVRKAMQYAVNKEAFRTARGGPTAGDFATTMLVPTLPEHENFDLYPAPPQGDPAKAKEMLAAAGYPKGFAVTLTTNNKGKGVTTAEAVQAGLARVGVKVNVTAVDQSVYYTTIEDTAKESELVFFGWCPDWPSASTVLPVLFWGKNITPQGNDNVSQLRDPQLDKTFARLESTTDKGQLTQGYREADRRIMELAAVVPLLNEKVVLVRGSKVTNTNQQMAFGAEYDLVSIGVAR